MTARFLGKIILSGHMTLSPENVAFNKTPSLQLDSSLCFRTVHFWRRCLQTMGNSVGQVCCIVQHIILFCSTLFSLSWYRTLMCACSLMLQSKFRHRKTSSGSSAIDTQIRPSMHLSKSSRSQRAPSASTVKWRCRLPKRGSCFFSWKI